mmetsp:Transcript_61432/g.143855  ORF Transcript_61432/g.143855 Transcript_61432/m.143855 type:complete len:894 (-) Transcript_61432:22-2703(-)
MLQSCWEQVPGYDSDGEASESGEQQQDSDEEAPSEGRKIGYEQLLQTVKTALGERWTEVPFIDLAPVQPGAKFTSLARYMTDGRGLPPAFRIDRIHAPLVRDTFLHNGFRPTKGEDWLISWTGPRMRENVHKLMHEFQRVNHFPSSTELTRKDRLWDNFQRMAKMGGGSSFDFVPETFILPQQLRSFKQRYLKTRGEQLWIVKPAASSQGRGIFILRNLIELPLKESVVVSRYVEKPMLIQGLKFDLRIYVLVTSFSPLRAYIYREGLTRFASRPYSTDEEHLTDVYRHLTNYSINKGAENFQENQRVQADNYGHKWSLSALNRHLRCVGVDVKDMWSRIMDLIVKTLLGVEPVISASTKEACIHEHSCFELYGFDVLVDENLKPWLLEVNLSPSMQADSPLDKQIKSSLLTDAFNLLGVRKLDSSTLTSARLRARFLYMNKLQRSMPGKSNNLTGHRQDPLRRADDGEAEGPTPTAEEEASPPPLARRFFSHRRPVALDQLGESQLKLLGDALQESLRCNNFIRLYPTPATIRRYAPISQLRTPEDEFRAQLLVAVLFARLLPSFSSEGRPRGEELEELEPVEEPAEQPESPEMKKVLPLPAASNMKVIEEALQTLKVLGSKMSSQLLLMEYLIRLLNISAKLGDNARRKLDSPQQSAIAGVLSVFRQQLTLWLRGSKKQRPPSGEGKRGDVVEQVEEVCLQALVQILCDTWGGTRDSAMKAVAAMRAELSLVRVAPEPFVQSSSGCRGIKALGQLAATDLESIFRAPQCPPELKSIFLVPEPDGPLTDGVGWNVLRRMSQAGPLSELEFLQHVTLQPPRPTGPLRSPESSPPLNPRLILSSSSPQLQKRTRPAGPLAPLGHRLPFPSGVAYSRKSMLNLGALNAVSSDIEL